MLAELAATASKDSLQGLLTDCRNTGNQMSVQIKNLMRDTTKMGNSIRQYQSMLNVNMTEQEKLNALLNQKNLRIAAERCAAQSQKRCIIHPSGYGMSRCGSLPVAGSRPAKLQGR